ncbi:MAG TPA: PTS sugar transporter subunit IIA [Opitutaceae bacterium]|nr:PTS sugar transporter subunit IIA [Opitutaceae bacterium]
MSAKISDLIDPARVALHLPATDARSAIEQAAALLESHADVKNFAGFLSDLHERAALDTVCLGNGLALPHARTPHVRKIVLAIGRTEQPVTFSGGTESARLLFVVGTPKSSPGDYLQVVGALCRLMKNPHDRDVLMAARTPREFLDAVITIEDRSLATA